MFTYDALFSRIQSAAWLGVLVGDHRPRLALLLARDVWEQFPAFFPDFAEELAETAAAPHAACWNLAALLADVPGSYDLWKRATELAAA